MERVKTTYTRQKSDGSLKKGKQKSRWHDLRIVKGEQA